MNWIETITIAVFAVFVLSVLYRLLPARKLAEERPPISMFPKYQFTYTDEQAVTENLVKSGFKPAGENRYRRGSYFGDFLPSLVKLEVILDRDSKTATLASPLVVIAFDTGDLWNIANNLRGT